MRDWAVAIMAGIALVVTGEFGLPVVITALTWYTGFPTTEL